MCLRTGLRNRISRKMFYVFSRHPRSCVPIPQLSIFPSDSFFGTMAYEWKDTRAGQVILARWCPVGFEGKEVDTERVPTWNDYLDSRKWVTDFVLPPKVVIEAPSADEDEEEDVESGKVEATDDDGGEEEEADGVIERNTDPDLAKPLADPESAHLTGLALLEWVVQRDRAPDVYNLQHVSVPTKKRDGRILLEYAWRCSENAFVRVSLDIVQPGNKRIADRADLISITIDKVGRGAGEGTIGLKRKEIPNAGAFMAVDAKQGRVVTISGRIPRGPWFPEETRHHFCIDRLSGGTAWYSGSPGSAMDEALRITTKQKKALETEMATWRLPAPPVPAEGDAEVGEQEMNIMQAVFDDGKRAFLSAATKQIIKPEKLPKARTEQCNAAFFMASQLIDPENVRKLMEMTM